MGGARIMAKLVIGTDKTVVVPAIVKEVEKQEPYTFLSRVKDDNNTDIGIVIGYHTDANNQKYAVVCLNAAYRSNGNGNGLQWLSVNQTVPDMPAYSSDVITAIIGSETATSNCDAILAFANANGYTSSAVSACRSQSFVIGGTTYYGQLPTISYMLAIFSYADTINNNDPTATQKPNLIIQKACWWASNQYQSGPTQPSQNAFITTTSGLISNRQKNQAARLPDLHQACTILEIPIN
jgi:hypothetical protein